MHANIEVGRIFLICPTQFMMFCSINNPGSVLELIGKHANHSRLNYPLSLQHFYIGIFPDFWQEACEKY